MWTVSSLREVVWEEVVWEMKVVQEVVWQREMREVMWVWRRRVVVGGEVRLSLSFRDGGLPAKRKEMWAGVRG